MRITVPTLVFVCLAAACAPAAATAQDRAYAPSLSRAEIVRSGATDLLSAITKLRPSWLAGSVIVYVDGRHLGDLPVLSTLDPEGVAGVRLVSEYYVQRTDRRYPRTPFTAAIWVSTRSSEDLAARHARTTITVYGVAPVHGMHAALSGALADAGYRFDNFIADDRVYRVDPDAPPYMPGVGVGAAIALRPPLGMEAQVEHVFPSAIGRFGAGSGAVAATFSYTDATVMATYRKWPGRLAGGAILRSARWTWGRGLCGCNSEEESRSFGYGLAANAGTLILAGSGVVLEARGGLRYFFSHEAPAYGSVPALDLSGPEIVVSFGIGLHR